MVTRPLSRRAFMQSGTAAALATRLFAAPDTSTKPNPELENLGEAALHEAKRLKASYADIRIIRYRQQYLTVRLNPERGTGKTLEVPVKRILMGAAPSEAASVDSLANPHSLEYFVELAQTLR